MRYLTLGAIVCLCVGTGAAALAPDGGILS